jgi:hypothetical protein
MKYNIYGNDYLNLSDRVVFGAAFIFWLGTENEFRLCV